MKLDIERKKRLEEQAERKRKITEALLIAERNTFEYKLKSRRS